MPEQTSRDQLEMHLVRTWRSIRGLPNEGVWAEARPLLELIINDAIHSSRRHTTQVPALATGEIARSMVEHGPAPPVQDVAARLEMARRLASRVEADEVAAMVEHAAEVLAAARRAGES